MPDTTYLQIEDADTDVLRVVELPGAAIRVGRGPVCEVRLTDPDLADVQCLLRRRGQTWHVQPIGPAGLVSLAGQAVDQLRPLPPDEPLRVGSFRLLIRHEGGDRFRSPIEVESSVETRAAVLPDDRTAEANVSPGRGASDAERLRNWQARADLRGRWLQARQEEKKWEARWRAAGEGLRARGGASSGRRADDERPRTAGELPARAERPADARTVAPEADRSARPLPAPTTSSPLLVDRLDKEPRRAPTVAAPGADSSGVIAPAGPPPAESLPEISRPPGAGPDGTTARVSRGLRVPAKDLAIDDAVGTPISDSATALTVRGEPLSDVQVVPAGNARRPVGEKAEVARPG